MARGTNTDFATTLGMLHTAITNTNNDLRDALGKSVEKLEASGQAAQENTTRNVVDELGRMRANLRETRDRLSAGGDALNAEVRHAVAQLQAEMRDVRTAVEGITTADQETVTSASHALSYEPAARDAQRPEAPHSATTSPNSGAVATAPDYDASLAEPFRVAIPTQRDGNHITFPDGTVAPVDLIRQTVQDAIADALAPLTSLLSERTDELHQQLDAVRQEARAELAAVREDVAGLQAGLERLRPSPVEGDPVAAEVTEEHSELLKQAARVSSVDLLCHRDVWEFITAEAGRHPHFRVPPQVCDEGGERVRAALSGRSLIALLISLNAVGHTSRGGDGDRELAATLYERIRANLTGLTQHGEPVIITLDDRSLLSDDTPATTIGDHEDGSGRGPSSESGDHQPS
ncbi:hypothetical protein ACFWGI_04890 [Streptomyces niveus]|uniref:hypothetical protein n=1 Tax=Streptomyces niveus TaxID=193462 RepID=UPI003650E28A